MPEKTQVKFIISLILSVSQMFILLFVCCGKQIKKGSGENLSIFSTSVPRPGIEPGWVAPLVFETSASTDSAIWASVFLKCDAKV